MDPKAATVSITETLCIETASPPCGVVIFGASGDLSQRKLIPSLFSLYQRNLLPQNFFVVGFSRTTLGDDGFRDRAATALQERFPQDHEHITEFLKVCFYVAGDYSTAAPYRNLAEKLDDLGQSSGTLGNIVFYLSTPPELCETIVRSLFEAGLLLMEPQADTAWRRVIIEKPFGHDLESAARLDRSLRDYLREEQVYRIDHYLGKETVQNILMLRFANSFFEPLWNRGHVDHVQITVAESIGIGHRAGYYEHTGLLRDMFQNHMLQLLALVAMEAPAAFDADQVRDEKLKVLRCVRPLDPKTLDQHIVRGQYGPGTVDGHTVCAYTDEDGVTAGSTTETFTAARLMIDNWRWQGVPFYLRSGKRLPRRVSEIAIVFKPIPHSIFTPLLPEHLTPNVLVLNVQPDEGIALTIQAKRPGPKLCMADLTMAFNYRQAFNTPPPEAYERLLLDAMLGDQTLFIRRDNVELSWQILMPVLELWEKTHDLQTYPAGTWGPDTAHNLLAADGRTWRIP